MQVLSWSLDRSVERPNGGSRCVLDVRVGWGCAADIDVERRCPSESAYNRAHESQLRLLLHQH